MRGMLLVARRDLAGYLNSMWGYAVIAAVLALDGLLFNAFAVTDQPKYSSKVIEDFFLYSFGSTIAASILLTMRVIAEERQTGTIVLVDSTPLAGWQIVLGKYLSGLSIVLIMVALTATMPALVFVNGKVSYGHIFAGYLGLVCVAAGICALGTLASALVRSQIVAGFISLALMLSLLLMWLVAKVSDPPLKDVFSAMSLFDSHFKGFMQGKINLDDLVFWTSMVFVSLVLATRFMAGRRWR